MRRDEVHVIALALDACGVDTADLAALLDDGERARAARLLFESDRIKFIVAHGLVRQALGSCLAIVPSAVRFDIGPRGKPRLLGAPLDLRFNLSHSGDRALLAVAAGREVGVDVEAERPIDELLMARRFFSPAEYAALAASPDRRAAFFRGWARKESFIKARGDGLSFPLNGFDVSLEPHAEQLLLACHAAPGDLARWSMRSVPAPAGYAAAVTAEGHDWRLVLPGL